jgi:hypothetical protein
VRVAHAVIDLERPPTYWPVGPNGVVSAARPMSGLVSWEAGNTMGS